MEEILTSTQPPEPKTVQFSTVSLHLPSGPDLPEEILLAHFGRNDYTQNGGSGSFELTTEDADRAAAEFAERGRDLVIDYEHQSLSGEKAPAAGWIDRLYRTEQGLSAHVRYWTEEAAALLRKGEYRYFSPTLQFAEDHSTLISVHSVALTNHPALHQAPALAANDAVQSAESQQENALQKFLEKYAFRDLGDASEKLDAFLESQEKCPGEAGELVRRAFHDGKLAECQRVWAERFAAAHPAEFRDWAESAPRIIPDNRDLDGWTAEADPQQRSSKSFSETQLKIFRLLGVDPETILE